MADRTVVIKVTDQGLSETTKKAEKLNSTLDQAAQPRKVRAASAALSTSTPAGNTDTGLTRGTAGTQGRGDARDFGRQAQGLGGLVHVYATFAANVFAVSAAFNALSKAADFTNMQKAADILSLKVGTSINGLAKDMKNLTDGAISMSEALSSASLGASAGLTSKQIKELTSVAKGASIALGRDMADAMSRVFRGTIKIEPELLDELGLMVKVDDANKKYAKTLNKTVGSLTDYERRQAFVNAVTEQGIKKYKELADQAVNPYSKLISSIQDLGTSTLSVLNSALAPFISALSTSPTALLLGLTAIVTLLLKQAVPALSNLRLGWEAADKAAQQSIKNQLDYINKRKAANASAAAEELKESKTNLLATTQALENTVKKSSIKGTSFSKDIRAFLYNVDPKEEKNLQDKALKSYDSLITKLQDKLDKKQLKINLGGFDEAQKARAYKDIEHFKDQIHAADVAKSQILAQASAAGHAAEALTSIHRKDAGVIAAEANLTKLEKLGERRAALSKAYEATETLGTRAGYARLTQELKALEGQHSRLDLALAKTRGSFGILTTSVSRLLGTFSVWAAAIGIGIVTLSGLLKWTGAINDKLTNLETTTSSLTDTFKIYTDIQDKLLKTSNLAEVYTLNASSARAYADALELASKRSEEFSKFNNQTGFVGSVDKQVEALKYSYANSGQFGKEANLPTAQLVDKLLRDNPELAKKYAFSGGSAEQSLSYQNSMPTALERSGNIASFGLRDFSLDRRQKDISSMNSIVQDNPELIRKSKEFADNADAMAANLKDLDTISSEYLTTLQSQSKHLKVLNSLSSSTSNLFKNLGNGTKDIASVVKFLNGITEQLTDMAGIQLSPRLMQFKAEVQKNEELIAKSEALGIQVANGDPDKINAAKAAAIAARVNTTEAAAVKSGYKNFNEMTIDLATDSLKLMDAFGKLASSAADASVAQAALSASLKKTQFLAGLSSRSSGILATAEYKTEAQKVAIENNAKQTNINTLKTQRSIELDTLKASLGYAHNAELPESFLVSDARSKITGKTGNITAEERGVLSASLGRLAGVQGAISIAQAEIKVNTLSLPSSLQTRLDPKLKSISDEQNTITDEYKTYFGKQTIDLEKQFSGLIGIGSDTADALYAYKLAIIGNEESMVEQEKTTLGLTQTLEAMRVSFKGLKGKDDIAAANNAITETSSKLEASKQAQQKTTQEGTKLTTDFNLEKGLKALKETNLLKIRFGELDEISGRVSSDTNNILQIKVALEEEIYKLKTQAKIIDSDTLRSDIAKKEAAAAHSIVVINLNRELRIQAETLSNIENLFSSNKPSTGLLNAEQIKLISQAYTEILAKQKEIDISKLNELTGNEKIIAQEALRVKYLEKQLALEESILDAKERATQPFEINSDLLGERFKVDAKKFRDTLDSYNKTVVGASYKAVDTFVDGITNAVKNLDFNLKNIIRDTVFAFDDMMMEYAGNQLKAIMKDAIAGIFGKPDMFKSPAEIEAARVAAEAKIIAEKQAKDLNILSVNSEKEASNAYSEKILKDSNVHTEKFDSMISLLDSINTAVGGVGSSSKSSSSEVSKIVGEAKKLLGTSTKPTSGQPTSPNFSGPLDPKSAAYNESGLNPLWTPDYTLTDQGTQLAGQTSGFTPSELFDWGGTQADILAAQNAEFSDAAMAAQAAAVAAQQAAQAAAQQAIQQAAQQTTQNSTSSWFDDIKSWFGFATGGSFTVGGSGGTDTTPVSFKATPGEQVSINTPSQVLSSNKLTSSINNLIPAAAGLVTTMQTQSPILGRIVSSLSTNSLNPNVQGIDNIVSSSVTGVMDSIASPSGFLSSMIMPIVAGAMGPATILAAPFITKAISNNVTGQVSLFGGRNTLPGGGIIPKFGSTGTDQKSLLNSQEFGFSSKELASWKGSISNGVADEIKGMSTFNSANNKWEATSIAPSTMIVPEGSFDFLNTSASNFIKSADTMKSSISTFDSTMSTTSKSFTDSIVNFATSSSNFIQGLFSGSSSSGSSSGGLLGSLVTGFLDDTQNWGSRNSKVGYSFGASNSDFSAADNAWFNSSNISAFATGGDFKVGGQGATDSKLVQFMATPGEQVIVKTPEQQKDSGGSNMHVVNHFTITGGTTSRESQQQISAKVGASIQRAMARNN